MSVQFARTLILLLCSLTLAGARADAPAEVARFKKECPVKIAQAPGFKEMDKADQTSICGCVNQELETAVKANPAMKPAQFGGLVSSALDRCSVEGTKHLTERACLQDKDIGSALKDQDFSVAQVKSFCACLADETITVRDSVRDDKQDPAQGLAQGKSAAQRCMARVRP